MPSCYGFTLEEATIDQMQDAMSSGKLTSVQLVTCYMKRIYQTDQYIKYVALDSFEALISCISYLTGLIV